MTSFSSVPPVAEIEEAFAGRYTRLTPLKQGGQGIATRATTQDGVDVALKVYDPRQVEERSEREVAALRALKSDRLVRLHEAGKVAIGGVAFRFIATTYVEGKPLADLLSGGPLEMLPAARIVRDVSEAIEALWELQIVHRDVKPDNIIVTTNGGAVLIDLGIARHLTQKTITTAGHTYGTVGYFAPEHIAGRRLTCKADIFATGIVFQEMLLGYHPTGRRQELLMKGGPTTAPMLPKLPLAVATLIDKMVAEKHYDRPKPEEVRAEVELFIKVNERKR